jgi:predicted glycoside hydrolase/deacetylase ChbG (UPF0249 family)
MLSNIRVIVNADDLGISEGVNDAIFALMSERRVTSATLLANAPAVEQAARRLQEFPNCSFGVHLNLTEFKPLTRNAALAPILAGQGEFAGNRIRGIRITSALRDAIVEEWCAQIERLRALGVPLSHIDSHHHVHTIAALFLVLKRVQRLARIWKVRISMNLYSVPHAAPALLLMKKQMWNCALRNVYPTHTTDVLADLPTFLEVARRLSARRRTVELMVHPGNPLYPDDIRLLRSGAVERVPTVGRLLSYKELPEGPAETRTPEPSGRIVEVGVPNGGPVLRFATPAELLLFTDLRFTGLDAPTGVTKHIVQMARGLAASEKFQFRVLACTDQLKGRVAIPEGNALAAFAATPLPLPWKVAEGLWTVTGRPYADRWCGGADWVYCPKNDFIPVRNARVAVTIHGAPELDPAMPRSGSLSARANRWRRRTAYARALRQAALVLSVSEFLKGQVIEWFHIEPEKICVIGNGVEHEFFAAAGLPHGCSGEPLNRPYVLCVGGLNFLDGGERVVAFAAALRRRAPELRVLVAGVQHTEDLSRKAAELPNLALLGYVKAERLALYMRDAQVLFFPTRYETFGIAAGEAMAAGTPVVTCRCTAVPEIVSNAGLYGDADSAEEMVDLVMSLVNDSKLRARYSALGRERAKAFTWEACVQRLSQALLK